MTDYIRTDDMQWRRRTDYGYELIEVRAYGRMYVVVWGTIDPADYTERQIEDCIRTYGYDSIEDVRDRYGTEADAVMAECLFEMTNEIDLNMTNAFSSKEEAIKMAQDMMSFAEKMGW